MHVLVVNQDADTGRVFNPAPPRKWREQFDHVRDLHNAENGWADPTDPARARPVGFTPPRSGKQLADWTDRKAAIYTDLMDRAARGELPTRGELMAALAEHGEVIRDNQTKAYLSIAPHDGGRNMRLKGELFALDCPNDAATPAPIPARDQPDLEAAAQARKKLAHAIETRARYGRSRRPKT